MSVVAASVAMLGVAVLAYGIIVLNRASDPFGAGWGFMCAGAGVFLICLAALIAVVHTFGG